MGRHSPRRNKTEDQMIKLVDTIKELEKFRDEILPALKRDVAAGVPAEDIYRKYQSYLAARAVTLALTEKDGAKALGAIKEVLDRGQGKAVERVDVTHKYDKLKEDELDSLLKSKLRESITKDPNKKIQ